MLRSEIIDATNHLGAALEISGIKPTLEAYMEGLRTSTDRTKKSNPEAILLAFQKYQHEHSKFSTAERELASIFGLEPLSLPQWGLDLLQLKQIQDKCIAC